MRTDTWKVASDRTEADGIAVRERDRGGDPLGASKRSVLAAAVLEHRGVGRHDDPRMTAGDGRRVEPDLDVSIPSNDVFAARQREAPAVRFEPAPEASRRRVSRFRQRHRITAERVAEAMHGPHELGRAGRVIERGADFGDEVREVGLGDEGAGPETFLQVCFGDRLRPRLHERRQQVERLGLEMNVAAGARQLPASEIERERAEERVAPRILSMKPAESLEIPWDTPTA